jgi:hypothetical protein
VEKRDAKRLSQGLVKNAHQGPRIQVGFCLERSCRTEQRDRNDRKPLIAPLLVREGYSTHWRS